MSIKIERGFKGVWIPANIWKDTTLTIMEKVFLVEIDSLDNDGIGCYASNAYFSDFFGISKGRCTQIIKSLESKKFITIDLERKGKQIIKRYLRVVNNLNRVVKILNNPSENIKQPYLENDEDNNTVFNNIKNINIESHFDLVWKLYPLKKGKGKISSSKKKAMSKFSTEQWEVIIKRYDKSITDKTFLMHGSTFFNGGYVDFIDENYQELEKAKAKKYTNTKKYDFAEQKAAITDEEKESNINLLSQFKRRG